MNSTTPCRPLAPDTCGNMQSPAVEERAPASPPDSRAVTVMSVLSESHSGDGLAPPQQRSTERRHPPLLAAVSARQGRTGAITRGQGIARDVHAPRCGGEGLSRDVENHGHEAVEALTISVVPAVPQGARDRIGPKPEPLTMPPADRERQLRGAK